MVIVVAMMMMPAAGRVGTRFGVEWRVDIVDVTAQTDHHFSDYMVRADPDTVAKELDRKVTVTEMPGDADQFAIVMRVDFQQRLGFCPDPDNAVFDGQAVAVAEANGLREVKQDFGASFCSQGYAAPVAAIEVDQNLVGFGRRIPGSGGQYLVDPGHAMPRL